MGFSMRINFVDVICDNSLKAIRINDKDIGYGFDIRLSYYRGAYLSCIDEFELRVDGELVDNQDITFSINSKTLPVSQLSSFASEFWQLIEPAKIEVIKEGGLSEGEHDIDLKLMLRVPYLPIPVGGGEHMYMPLDSCGQKTLVID